MFILPPAENALSQPDRTQSNVVRRSPVFHKHDEGKSSKTSTINLSHLFQRRLSPFPSKFPFSETGNGTIPSLRELSSFHPLTVTAADEDAGSNGRVSYSQAMRGSAASFFRLDQTTGRLSLQNTI